MRERGGREGGCREGRRETEKQGGREAGREAGWEGVSDRERRSEGYREGAILEVEVAARVRIEHPLQEVHHPLAFRLAFSVASRVRGVVSFRVLVCRVGLSFRVHVCRLGPSVSFRVRICLVGLRV